MYLDVYFCTLFCSVTAVDLMIGIAVSSRVFPKMTFSVSHFLMDGVHLDMRQILPPRVLYFGIYN